MNEKSFYFFFFGEEDQPCANICQSSSFFAEEDWPWVNICARLPPLYMGRRHNMACQAVCWCAPRIRTDEPHAAAAERARLTTCTTGPA